MAISEEQSQYARRLQARMRAKAVGLNPDDLDWDDAERRPTFNPNGTTKSVEVTALIRLLEARHAQQTTTKKSSKKKEAA